MSVLPHCKVEEQPSKRPKKSLTPQNGRSDDKGAVAIVKTVPQLGCVSQTPSHRNFQNVARYTCRTPHFHRYSHCTDHTARMHVYIGSRGLRAQDELCAEKTSFHPRVMFYFAPHSTLNTSTSSLSPAYPVLLSSSSPNPDLLSTYPTIHCEDPLQELLHRL